ncbi:hypothetical protein DAPPUDRAFT_234248 [Daphnia pulex]|uniref:Uncharacterized protein n=1 Tax=Daphnia pulex TaxID=6669 RepID=E9FUZ1_DAPPU|nr:hypothetical protein DAPPUDRAFT_234248 [Daphnia pulex]|eukprot:EFX88832.1 hypothetical protein DAPPUDRAFT_234248 [Daphnia pulex]
MAYIGYVEKMDFLIFNSRHRSPSDVAPASGANETRSNHDRHRDSSSTWIIVLLEF